MSNERTPLFSVALAALVLCALAPCCMAQTYTLDDLGAIAGNSVSTAYALSDAGQAAGTSSTPTSAIAVLFNNGKVTDISTLGSDVSVATGINGSGEIVGWNDFYSNPDFSPEAFLYSNGRMKSINAPSVFPAGTEAVAVNNAGELVGTGYFSGENFHAFLYRGGKMKDLGPPGAYQASATSSGEFLISNDKMTTLPVPAGASAVAAFGLNDWGEIVGTIFFASGAPSHAAKFANGAWTDLGAVAGALASRATSVNQSGAVVGTAFFAQTQYHPPKPGKHVPFISTANGLVNLNTLIPAATGFILTDAVAINDLGLILCNATNSGGSKHAVLLKPR